MLRKIRIIAAAIFFVLVTLLFLDFTGTIHAWIGWTAKVQFLPALLALNFGVVAALVILTLILGRIYCSVICPLGVMQDIISWFAGKRKKNRFSYSPAKKWLRYGLLVLFAVAIVAGLNVVAMLIAPYSSYGRIAQNLLAPTWGFGNNILAYIAEIFDGYAFYPTQVVIRSWATFGIAVATFVAIFILAWRNGRTYCNTICPVGTLLGAIARFSWLKPVINTEKCIDCGLCARKCKAACIDAKNHKIDYTRCVVCMDCLESCSKNAISYTTRRKAKQSATAKTEPVVADNSRRNFLIGAGLLASSAVKAQEMKLDGGYATIIDKKAPDRKNPIMPAGSRSARNMGQHCTGCQLCVAVCPTQVLRPSTDMKFFMQPSLTYEKGYCRPECNKCSQVCPTGAISPISLAEKSAIQIGHAVWVKQNCIVITDDVDCGNCERHCPTAAITMERIDPNNRRSRKIPVVNKERCIGCGACESLCPSRPFSAIYVKGYKTHHTI